MEDKRLNHQLLAIRMSWLYWLSTPIIFCWNYVVECFAYFWILVKLAWKALKDSLHQCYWALGFVGGVAGILVLTITLLIGLSDPENLFMWLLIGSVFNVLPSCWVFAEVANLKSRSPYGVDMDLRSLRGMLGNGMKAISFLGLYVCIVVLLVLAEVMLSSLVSIPTVGPLFLGILSLPLIAASVIILLIALILNFGTTVLGAHLLKEEVIEGSRISRFTTSSISLIKVIAVKWLDILLVGFPSALLALGLMLIPGVLVALSIGLTMTIVTMTVGDSIMATVQGVLVNPGFFGYLGVCFLVVSLSVIGGLIVGPGWAFGGSVAYDIYHFQSQFPFYKKFSTLFLLGGVFFLIPLFGIGFVTVLFGQLFGQLAEVVYGVGY